MTVDAKSGARILDEVEDVFRQHLYFPDPNMYTAVTLWCVATWLIQKWSNAPRMAVTAPTKGCGKTRVLEVAQAFVFSPKKTSNISPAALTRVVDKHQPPTLLVDETDTVFSTAKRKNGASDDLQNFYNAGFQRGEKYIRCAAEPGEVIESNTFAMVMLCGIGDLPDTIMSRAVVLRMRPRPESHPVKPWRVATINDYKGLRERLVMWVRLVQDKANDNPELPVEDRAADVWSPLVAVADLAGGHWPEKARMAAKEMTEQDAKHTIEGDDKRLLRDIRSLWPADEPRIHTTELIQRLNNDGNLAWDRYVKGGPLHAVAMAKLLHNYQLQAKNVRIEGKLAKGYFRADFVKVWNSYVPKVS